MNDSIKQERIADTHFTKVLFPFSINIDPMEKLLLVNFEKNPDAIYLGFEPQVFNDTTNGIGHLVIGWRTDKRIDVYHQKSLNPDPLKYSIAGAGLNEMIPLDMENAYYEVNDSGVQAHYKFRDLLGREVELFISEKNKRKRNPFGLLAPMGDAATNPTSLPIVLLHDFYFVRKNQTDIKISINGISHKVDALPIRMDGQKMTFVRYSPKPLIATLNPACHGELKSFELSMGQKIYEKDDNIYEMEWVDQTPFVKSMCVKNNIHLLTIRFTPSFPCLKTIHEKTKCKGNFIISGHESVGSISGEYTIESKEKSIHIRVVPSNGWTPKATKFSTWFLFAVAKVFKKWPTTYQWDAELQKNPEDLWNMQSKWIRTGKILKD